MDLSRRDSWGDISICTDCVHTIVKFTRGYVPTTGDPELKPGIIADATHWQYNFVEAEEPWISYRDSKTVSEPQREWKNEYHLLGYAQRHVNDQMEQKGVFDGVHRKTTMLTICNVVE
jgi:hypothetical protein